MPTSRDNHVTHTAGTGRTACPFFVGHSAPEIQCEGLADETRLSIRFNKECDKKLHKRVFCDDRYKNCELCRMLLREKYEED